MADFLLEIGLEEIPARMIAGAEAELSKRLMDLLSRERLIGPGARITTYSTPRRLAVLVEEVLIGQADREEKQTGPSWNIAFKGGVATPAAEAFAKKAGVAVAELEKVTNAKGEYAAATVRRAGLSASQVLAAELAKEVLSLYWAKNMYWRAGKPERFVRPVRWVVALLDAAVVPVEVAGISAGRSSRGHRVLHGASLVEIDTANSYSAALRAAFVMVDAAERRHTIRKALDAATRTVPDARWREDEALVETVVHLTEWPSVVLGDFEAEYLALPEEVLVTVMRDHQKYFAVESADGKLAPHFLAVLNTQVDEEGQAIIRHGNARVLRARFKDAKFFWDFDQKTPLAERVESLRTVTFQKELGSYFEKTGSNDVVAFRLHEILKSKNFVAYSYTNLIAAIRLAKTDLTTELVKEFTELQGIIGGLYALAQGHNETVANAIYSQYLPASGSDPIPTSVEGQLLGIVDRVQTISAMFSIGNAPTGSKDPFALRRAANAVVKILAESELPLTVSEVVGASIQKPDSDGDKDQVAAFFLERISFYLKEGCGFAYDVVNAVTAADADDVRDAVARAEALTVARSSEDFAAISAAFKRIKNILRQAEEKKYSIDSNVGAVLAPEAQNLADAAEDLAPRVAQLRKQHSYAEALAAIATLRPQVDEFFDKVMVLDPNPAVRGANLGLIDQVLRNFSNIADFSEMVTA